MLASDMTHIGWQDYLAIIIRRRWFFAVPCAMVVVIAMIMGLFMPKIYRAEAILMVQDKSLMNPLIQGLAISTPASERLRILREEMLSWTSLGRLVNELKLDQHAKSPLAFERLIKRLQRDIDVRMRGRDLVTIVYEDRDPKLAQTVVNTITQIYMDRSVESQSAEAETAIIFIEGEMGVYQQKLEDSERALREFKELYVMQMPVANELNTQIIDLEVSLAGLLVENTDEHPVVVQVTRQIDELKRKRNAEIKRVILTALAKGSDPKIYQDLGKALEDPLISSEAEAMDPTVRAAKEAYRALVRRMDSPTTAPSADAPQIQVIAAAPGMDSTSLGLGAASASLSLAPREEQELHRLTRDYEVHAKTYQNMQERLEQAKVTQRLGESDEGTKFKILEPARLPLKPVRPDMTKIFFISLLLGMFVGAGCAFVAEYLDQSFQSADDLQAALSLPVLGSISTIMTEEDLAQRRRQRLSWMSIQSNLKRFQTYVLNPIWARIDAKFLRWGL